MPRPVTPAVAAAIAARPTEYWGLKAIGARLGVCGWTAGQWRKTAGLLMYRRRKPRTTQLCYYTTEDLIRTWQVALCQAQLEAERQGVPRRVLSGNPDLQHPPPKGRKPRAPFSPRFRGQQRSPNPPEEPPAELAAMPPADAASDPSASDNTLYVK